MQSPNRPSKRWLGEPVPNHPTHDVQYSETYVHVAKQKFRRNAAQTDKPTKLLVANASRFLSFGTLDIQQSDDDPDCLDADHLVIYGTFKSAPQLMTQMVGIHGIIDSGSHFPLAYGLLPGKTQTRLADICPNGHLSECLLTSIFGQMSVRTNIRFPDICPNQITCYSLQASTIELLEVCGLSQGLQSPDFYTGRPADFSYH
ncbi:hypothetical protein ACHWQZ_G007265 [Mnemiopsis leidyi]